MAKQVFSRVQYLQILNEALRHHPSWQPGMEFVFFPIGSRARDAKLITCTGPTNCHAIYAQVERVASQLCEVAE
jgi:hypothetical protein